MRHLIAGYRNRPGQHCGSTAMRNLLAHYCGLELPEAVVFGLGAGLDQLYLTGIEHPPRVLTFGRSLTMEVDAADALGIDYRETPEPDDDRAWRLVRDEVLAGRPTMLSGDAYPLDYRDFRVHFPAHRYVLLGFDEAAGCAYVADRIEADTQRCSLDALRRSRNPPDFVSTFNTWGKFHDPTVRRPLPEAFARALARNARRVLGDDDRQAQVLRLLARGRAVDASTGLAGVRRLGAELPGWAEAADRATIASYAASTIEKYGTGGGNFRAMYAEFLREARALVPDRVGPDDPELAAASAALWTRLSGQLAALADDPAAAPACAATVAEIAERETRLFESLAERSRGAVA